MATDVFGAILGDFPIARSTKGGSRAVFLANFFY